MFVHSGVLTSSPTVVALLARVLTMWCCHGLCIACAASERTRWAEDDRFTSELGFLCQYTELSIIEPMLSDVVPTTVHRY